MVYCARADATSRFAHGHPPSRLAYMMIGALRRSIAVIALLSPTVLAAVGCRTPARLPAAEASSTLVPLRARLQVLVD